MTSYEWKLLSKAKNVIKSVETEDQMDMALSYLKLVTDKLTLSTATLFFLNKYVQIQIENKF